VGKERLRECPWEPATKLVIPRDWPSGVYLGKLTAEREKLQSYVIFIVRDDRPCDFLFQCSDTTWSAYNRWPDQWSLYDDGKKEMYRNVKAAIAAGVNVAFFSADTCLGLMPFLPSTSGVPNRVISRVENFGPRMEEWAREGAPEVLELRQGPDQAALIGARDVYPSIWWSDGLSAPPGYRHPSAHGASPRGPDPRVRRITANLLERFRGG
jgi:hypothetical protein